MNAHSTVLLVILLCSTRLGLVVAVISRMVPLVPCSRLELVAACMCCMLGYFGLKEIPLSSACATRSKTELIAALSYMSIWA